MLTSQCQLRSCHCHETSQYISPHLLITTPALLPPQQRSYHMHSPSLRVLPCIVHPVNGVYCSFLCRSSTARLSMAKGWGAHSAAGTAFRSQSQYSCVFTNPSNASVGVAEFHRLIMHGVNKLFSSSKHAVPSSDFMTERMHTSHPTVIKGHQKLHRVCCCSI